VPDHAPAAWYVHLVHVIDDGDDVPGAGVHRVEREARFVPRHLDLPGHDGVGFRRDRHVAAADLGAMPDVGHDQAHFFLVAMVAGGAERRASQRIAAHGGRRSVGVEAPDLERGRTAPGGHHQSVSADAGARRAQAPGLLRPVPVFGRVGDQDEVISRAVDLSGRSTVRGIAVSLCSCL
jgi:hypothetical protein